MQPARRPPDEARRVEALQAYHVLETRREPALDDLTRLAAQLGGAPISVISLIDEQRQWFKSTIGWSCTEMPRDLSFCRHAILQPNLFIVPDAALDARFAPGVAFLHKPFTSETLGRKIREVLDQEHALSLAGRATAEAREREG